ncbi:MAG: acyltransferase [Bacteroidota bacterium]
MQDAKARSSISGLNSLRAFAFLAIFLFHSFKSFSYGYLGVDFFFVLSSFLLTYLALKEINSTGSFSTKNFFIRRALRIFPLYYLVVIGLLLILPLLAKPIGWSLQMPEHPWTYFVFVSNFDKSDHLFALKFLWSIAVEEQFYIMFLVFSIFFKNYFRIPIIFMLLSYTVYMLLSKDYALDTYSNLIPHFMNFLMGMCLGYIHFYKKNIKTSPIILFIFSLLVIVFLVEDSFTIYFSVAMALVIYLSIHAFKKYEVLSNRIFFITEYLGKYSYGLYVYSGIILTFSGKFMSIENVYLSTLINLTLTILLAILSYHIYEQWFIRLKKKFY